MLARSLLLCSILLMAAFVRSEDDDLSGENSFPMMQDDERSGCWFLRGRRGVKPLYVPLNNKM